MSKKLNKVKESIKKVDTKTTAKIAIEVVCYGSFLYAGYQFGQSSAIKKILKMADSCGKDECVIMNVRNNFGMSKQLLLKSIDDSQTGVEA